jgi:hypothetical protein
MPTGHGERLSRLQEATISALLTSPTITACAESLSLHPNTVRRWLQQPAFAQAYQQAREQLLARTIGRLQAAVFEVVDALSEDLKSLDVSTRHRAAQMILDATIRGTEALDLSRRLGELEHAMQRGTP